MNESESNIGLRNKLEVQVVRTHDTESIAESFGYPYCTIPSNYFDRLEADVERMSLRRLFTVSRWNGTEVLSIDSD